jgi:hypothetical protein
MTFFSKFNTVSYTFDKTTAGFSDAVNILNSARFIDLLPERSNKCYVDYLVKDGEKPEHISDRVYDRPDYHWIVLMSNEIYNPYFDWPLSTQELDSYIENKYPGTAIFYDCIGTQATQFYRKNSTTLLPQSKSQFIVGNTLTQNQGSRTVTATITEWVPTYRKLVVNNVSGGTFNTSYDTTSTNQDGVEFVATPKKVILYNADAVHHFLDDFNNYLDPYGRLNYYEYDDNKIYARQSIFYKNDLGLPTSDSVGVAGVNDFILNKYINGYQENAVSNRRHEEIENDKKRAIKVLRPEYVPKIIKQADALFK